MEQKRLEEAERKRKEAEQWEREREEARKRREEREKRLQEATGNNEATGEDLPSTMTKRKMPQNMTRKGTTTKRMTDLNIEFSKEEAGVVEESNLEEQKNAENFRASQGSVGS